MRHVKIYLGICKVSYKPYRSYIYYLYIYACDTKSSHLRIKFMNLNLI